MGAGEEVADGGGVPVEVGGNGTAEEIDVGSGLTGDEGEDLSSETTSQA